MNDDINDDYNRTTRNKAKNCNEEPKAELN